MIISKIYTLKCNYFLILFFFLSAECLSAQKANAPIIKLTGDPALKNGNVSFTLLDRKTGEFVAAHNPNMSLVPASSLKLLTCSYGLEMLKGDFRFKTQLEITGKVGANGVLKGDLILHGFGDPTLGSEMTEGSSTLDQVLNSFADAVIKAGIRSIDGNIYGDGSYFSNEGIYDSWLWNDIGNYYAAGIYGLNIYDNLYKLKFKQSVQGSSPDIATVYPNIPGLKFASEVLSAGPKSGDNAFIYGGPMQFNCKVRGSIPSGKGTFEVKGSMPDPPKVATWLLNEKLKEKKIFSKGIKSSLIDPLPDGKRTVLMTHYSLPLENIVQQTLLKSINLNAEAILRYCGAQSLPNSTIESAIKGFETFLRRESDNSTGFFLADGSGLSTLNSIPSYGFAKILRQKFQEKSISSILEASLPIAGVSGTMKSYLTNSPAKGKIRAKTGSMSRVRSFSGLLTGASGKEYVFTLIINNYSCSSVQIKSKVETFFDGLFKAS